jgi:two-component system sensor histidine kinase KdpD
VKIRFREIDWRGVFIATLGVLAAATLAPILQRLPHANLSLLFMTAVLLVAARYGLGLALYASILSFLIFNFFFTPPLLTFAVTEEGDVATLVFFLVIASLTGHLAARMRDEIASRKAALERISLLEGFTRQLAGAASAADVLRMTSSRIAEVTGVTAFAVLPAAKPGDAPVQAVSGPGQAPRLDAVRRAAAHEKHIDGWTILSLQTHRGRPIYVGVEMDTLDTGRRSLIDALTDQATVALDRALLVNDLAQQRLASERDQLRAALLASVSHDLRTPLASIIGSASSLVELDSSLSPENRAALLASVMQEAERLDRHIQNMLDMARLGQGELNLRPDWVDLRDIVGSATRRLRALLDGKKLRVEVATEAELVHVHGDLVEQAVVNALDNAIRFSPADGLIEIRGYRDGDWIHVDVSDQGPGIPEADRERVFDAFYRVGSGDRKTGTGLGLSICRGMIRAHGGMVTAHSAPGGTGCLIRMRLPWAPSP